MKESWKSVPNWPGYEISDQGRVKVGGRLLKPDRNPVTGYSMVKFRKVARKYIHEMVLELFDRPRPSGQVADHINRSRSDNRIENLRWTTPKGNALSGSQAGGSKLTEAQVEEIRLLLKQRVSQKDIGKRFGVAQTTISAINNGYTWN